jgi:Sulfotransferase family
MVSISPSRVERSAAEDEFWSNRVTPQDFTLAEREDRLTWILGSSRSGSTWLLRMLSAIDEVVPVDDPHLGHHLGVWRPIPLAWATAAEEMPGLTTLWTVKRGKQSYFFSDRYRDRWEPALRSLIVTRFDAQAHDVGWSGGNGTPMVVVKEPASHVADLLFSLFPRSRLIFLVRDGRDVVDSWMDAYSHGSWALDEGAYPLAPEGRLHMVKWLSTVWTYRIAVVQAAYERGVGSTRLMVRYEDLLADPVAKLVQIRDTLGLDASRERLEAIARDHSYERVSSVDKGGGKEVRAAKPGGWRVNLSAEEQKAMLEIMGEKLAELRYIPAATVPA